ncbi:Exocyst complex component 8 [Cichlidogyrus casuarinus]|uniref:Exocyst complex component 8 n=1 Tax=Cichlidogyrus casuarinus TaxID=1844966 RepID=A0ABD2Q7L3_9PLAT
MQEDKHANFKRMLSSNKFNPEAYVKEIAKTDDPDDIFVKLQDLTAISEETASCMKKSIFKNYDSYIQAGRAASSLELIMHEINNKVNDMQRLIKLISDVPLIRANQLVDGADGQQAVSKILEEVNGVSASDFSNNTSLLGIFFVYEIDEKSRSFFDRYKLYLCSDCLLLASIENREDRALISKVMLTNLDKVSLTDANAQDFTNYPPFTICLLQNMQTRYLKFENAPQKIDCLSRFQLAHRELMRQQEEGANHLFSEVDVPDTDDWNMNIPDDVKVACVGAIKLTLPKVGDLIEYKSTPVNSYLTLKEQTTVYAKDKPKLDSAIVNDAWVYEAPEDLDVALAERDFEKATALIEKVRERLKEMHLKNAEMFDMNRRKSKPQNMALDKAKNRERKRLQLAQRIDEKATQMANVLQQEIIFSSDRHGASRIVRKYVLYLKRLERKNFATQLFLVYRSMVLQHALGKGLRLEGNQLAHLNRMSIAFSRNLIETVVEFNIIIGGIPDQYPNKAKLISLAPGEALPDPNIREAILQSPSSSQIRGAKLSSWILEQAEAFADQLRLILMDSRSISFFIMCRAMERIHAHLHKVEDLIGMSFVSTVDHKLFDTWCHAIEEQVRIIREASEHRMNSEPWVPISFINEIALQKYCSDLLELGLDNLDRYLPEPGFTVSIGQFARAICNFSHCVKKLGCPRILPVALQHLILILSGEVERLKGLLKDEKFAEKRAFIATNIGFLIRLVIPAAIAPLQIRSSELVELLEDLNNLYKQFKKTT